MLTVTHLGPLENRDRLTADDVLSLTRANLPALGFNDRQWIVLAALASDIVDGRLARRTGTVSRFGTYADALADAVFWPTLMVRHEPDARWWAAALAAWAAPVAAVTALNVARGRMVDAPRPVVVRPAAAMQVLVAARRWRAADSSEGS